MLNWFIQVVCRWLSSDKTAFVFRCAASRRIVNFYDRIGSKPKSVRIVSVWEVRINFVVQLWEVRKNIEAAFNCCIDQFVYWTVTTF